MHMHAHAAAGASATVTVTKTMLTKLKPVQGKVPIIVDVSWMWRGLDGACGGRWG